MIADDIFTTIIQQKGIPEFDSILNEQSSVNVENSEGQSLLVALLLQHDLARAQKLIDKGAAVEALSTNGHVPLTEIADQRENFEEELKFLLHHGARANVINYHPRAHMMPLHYAVEQDNMSHILCLLEGGATLDAYTHDAYPPIVIAAEKGHFNCMRILLEHGANVNWYDSWTCNPALSQCLWLHTTKEAMDIYMPMLFDAGADINNGRSTFLSALRNGSVYWAKAILERGYHIVYKTVVPKNYELVNALDLVDNETSRCQLNELFGASGEALMADVAKFVHPHPIIVEMATDHETIILQKIVRRKIRAVLTSTSPAINLLVQVDQLPLPKALKRYLWFN